MINVAFGGTLYQDLSLIPNSYIQHFQKSRKHSPGHQVTIVKDTVLGSIFNETLIQTNSFHHLGIKDMATGFIVNAYAPDGVIEGMERSHGAPVLGVQWHPEMMYEKHPAMLGIFSRFIGMAGDAQES
jgi:putative glutamine amidotransferase